MISHFTAFEAFAAERGFAARLLRTEKREDDEEDEDDCAAEVEEDVGDGRIKEAINIKRATVCCLCFWCVSV